MKKDPVKTAKKILGMLICLLIITVNLMPQMQALRDMESKIALNSVQSELGKLYGELPISVRDMDGTTVTGDLSESLSDDLENYERTLTIELFGIPVKQVTAVKRDKVMLMPGGQSIGVKLYTKGALVVGFGDVLTDGNTRVRPAMDAGILVGDTVVEMDGVEVENAAHVTEICNKNKGNAVTIKVLRQGAELQFIISPAFDMAENEYKLGLWVRDSTAGIGTLSFYRLDNKRYGALGHAITDIDTGALLLAKQGEIVLAGITGVKEGEEGTPGEIKGTFSIISRRMGSISDNTEYGLFGTMYSDFPNEIYKDGIELAYPDEAEIGEATILSTVDDSGVCEYSCEIIKAYDQQERSQKGMVIQITDRRLLEKTGGIVQGMSGSPLIQNGKLLGVVTHVFVNDPTRGYCIYAVFMTE